MEQERETERSYLVQVTETVTTIGTVRVEASSLREAEWRAEDWFEAAECDNSWRETDTMVLTEVSPPTPPVRPESREGFDADKVVYTVGEGRTDSFGDPCLYSRPWRAGYLYPVALTKGVWDRCVAERVHVRGSKEGLRLEALLSGCWAAVRGVRGSLTEVLFNIYVKSGGEYERVRLKAVLGPEVDDPLIETRYLTVFLAPEPNVGSRFLTPPDQTVPSARDGRSAEQVVLVDTREAIPVGSLEAVVEYLWADEQADYDARPCGCHIHRPLRLVREWLDRLRESRGEDPVRPAGPRPVEVSADEAHWGLCPVCERNDGYLNLGCEHWMVCHAHRVRWCFGENVFSTWRDECSSEWDENKDRIWDYEEVTPVYHATCRDGTDSRGDHVRGRDERGEGANQPAVPAGIQEYTRDQVYE